MIVSEKYHCWTTEYDAWVQRVRDTHDAVRFTVAHRIKNWDRAENVAVHVVVAMLARPKVFRYQGLPYAGRIGSTAESILARPADQPLDAENFTTLVQYLESMPATLRPILVAAFVHGLTDGEIASAADISPEEVSAQRSEIEQYLTNFSAQHTPVAGGDIDSPRASHTT